LQFWPEFDQLTAYQMLTRGAECTFSLQTRVCYGEDGRDGGGASRWLLLCERRGAVVASDEMAWWWCSGGRRDEEVRRRLPWWWKERRKLGLGFHFGRWWMEDYDTCQLMVGLIWKVGIAAWHNLVESSLSGRRVQNRFLVVHFRRSVQIKSGGAFSSWFILFQNFLILDLFCNFEYFKITLLMTKNKFQLH